MTVDRPTLALALVACALGITIGRMDASPGFDDTGVTAGSLALLAFAVAFVARSRPWVWALLVGVWVPLFELLNGGPLGSVLALAFAMVGAALGWLVRRSLRVASSDDGRR